MTVSAIALAFAAPAIAQDEEVEDELVVTGTRIQGIDPVGSNVQAIGQEDIDNVGLTSSADLLRKSPQVLSFAGTENRAGGREVQGETLNTTYTNSPNLRGLGTAATLSLVNNHRVPPMGPNMQVFDSATIPLIAMERIEIFADGASAIYGSDAIAGVVNYIMRKPFDGAEIKSGFGFVDGAQRWDISGVFGQEWDTGGFMVAAEHLHRDHLEATQRPDLYSDDFSSYGGAPSSTFAIPGNVVVGNDIYGIPSGGGGDVNLSDLSTSVNRTNIWLEADASPEIDQDNVVFNFYQQLFEGVELFGDGFYSNREFEIDQTGRVGQTMTVPDTNPYSPCNAANAPFTNPYGIMCSGALTVQYNYVQDFGGDRRFGYEEVYNGVFGLRFSLPHEWSGEFFGAKGHSENRSNNDTLIRGSRLAEVLAGSVGSVPAFNPFCDGTPGCNSPETLSYIQGFNETGFEFDRTHFSANLGGPIFSVPGGDVSIAVGGEYYKDVFVNIVTGNTRGPESTTLTPSPARKVKAAFGELYLPVVGSGNAMPMVQSLNISAAVRFEDYNDFGSTTNPKIGVDWVPVEGVKIRGSYGTSFRAPSLADNNPASTAALLPRVAAGSTITDASYTGGAGSQPVTYIVGGNSALGPETARTWSLGIEWTPPSVEGLTVDLTYYNVKYEGKVDFPAFNAGASAALSDPGYDAFVLRNPRFFSSSKVSMAEFDAVLAALAAAAPVPEVSGLFTQYETAFRLPLPGSSDPNTVIAVIDGRRNNVGVVKTDGLDFSARYNLDTDFGGLRFGALATYVLNYEEAATPFLPLSEQVNNFGYPLNFRGRLEAGADMGRFSGTVFLNYTNSYEIESKFSAVPSATDIDSYTTVDLSLVYRTEDMFDWAPANDITFVFAVQNVFDQDPPLVLNNTSPGVLFDPSYGSALGRLVTFQLRKAF
ncbi:TonB-dependent receptor plug domain-containing protein [Hyphococcus luteus]|nr:TonB-dependent receptor [Marinicaulis flavus]